MIQINKKAFTLAETLVTLTIIGLVAVLVLPPLQTEIKSRLLEGQKKTFNSKLKEGLRQMQVNGDMTKDYATTDDFISSLSKYIKFAKTCENTNLDGCFTKNIKESKSSIKFVTSNIRTSQDIEASFPTTSNLGGLVFSDGSRAIIAHNPACVIEDNYDSTLDLTSCFAMLYDINGEDGPNIIGTDIDTINLSYGDYGNEIEIGTVFTPTSYTKAQCLAAQDSGAPIKQCSLDNDYWAMAADKCFKEGGKLPSRKQLKEIAMTIYGGENVNLGGTTENLPGASGEYWDKIGSGTFWAAEEFTNWGVGRPEYGGYSYYRRFNDTSTFGIDGSPAVYGGSRAISNYKAFCIK